MRIVIVAQETVIIVKEKPRNPPERVRARRPRRRIERNEDEEMNTLAGFIMDKGSYPWDVLS